MRCAIYITALDSLAGLFCSLNVGTLLAGGAAHLEVDGSGGSGSQCRKTPRIQCASACHIASGVAMTMVLFGTAVCT